MNVDLYERIWMWGVGIMLAVFFGTTAAAALMSQIHPPSHVETIDPRTSLTDTRFRRRGVRVDADGRVHATVVGLMFSWMPAELVLPADTPVTFHLTSPDVIHGFQIGGSIGPVPVPWLIPDMTALRIGKWCFAGPASGQNCETTAPVLAISRCRSAFSTG